MKNKILKNIKKQIVFIVILSLIIENLFAMISNLEVKADSFRYAYDGSNLENTSYKERIDAIKKVHPNWNFIIMETGLDFNDVVANEYTGHFDTPKNLIQGKRDGWICSICGSKTYDTGVWMCASESAIRYYLDPRNWLIDSPYLFQFLQTDYMETQDTDIYNSLNGTFLYSMENAKTINRICREKNASPYFIIARILQEQGTSGGMTYKMKEGGITYYNLFNIGATGNTEEEVYSNALERAKKEGWTSLESCLNGGISFLISSYISYKQNTLYLNKFDVESYLGLYDHQYMQNIEAPKNEAVSMYNKMKNANLLTANLTFVIPIYENMPDLVSPSPENSGEVFPKNIRVKEGHFGIMVRAGRSTTSTVLGRISGSSEVILSVERYTDGWHKIVLESGLVGYVKFNSDYLEEVADVTNCYEMKIINSDYTLKSGPGLEFQEITTLKAGDILYRIDNSGRYNFEGTIWDRVILKDGRQGFVARDVLGNLDEEKENPNTSENETDIKNNVEENNTNEENLVVVPNDTAEENIIIDDNEIENMVINETVNETVQNDIIENEIEENNIAENIIPDEIENNVENNETIEDDTKEDRKYLVISPDKQAKDLNGKVTKDGKEVEEAGTGYKIEIDGKEYIIVKRGDSNGDGYVKANDYLIIKDYIIGTNLTLKDEYLQASDVTNDKLVKANDYLKIKDHIMYGVEI